jgi:hypothetical protein
VSIPRRRGRGVVGIWGIADPCMRAGRARTCFLSTM